METNPVPPAEMESHSYNGDWSLLTQVGRIPHCLCSPVLLTCPGSLVPSSTWSIQHYWRFWSPTDHFFGSPLRIWNISVTSPKAAVKLLAFFFFYHPTLSGASVRTPGCSWHPEPSCLDLQASLTWRCLWHLITSAWLPPSTQLSFPKTKLIINAWILDKLSLPNFSFHSKNHQCSKLLKFKAWNLPFSLQAV